MKRALAIPLRRAFSSASATASGTVSIPQTSPAWRREREADRADSAVEVEDPLAPGEPRVVGGDRVQALRRLGVGLEEGRGRDSQPQARQLLLEELLAEHAGRPVGAAAGALDHGVQIDGRLGEARPRGDQPGLKLPGAAALADDEVAQHPQLLAPLVGGNPLAPRPLADLVAGRVVALRGQQAVLDVDHLGPAAAAVEAERQPAVALAERVLELVAVAPFEGGGLGRLELEARRGRRGGAGPRRPACASRRAGARRAAPARARRGRARRRGRIGRRSGPALGSTSSTACASPKSRFALVSRARTRSPGSAPETKTT